MIESVAQLAYSSIIEVHNDLNHELNRDSKVLVGGSIMNKLMIATILTASAAVAQPALADYDTVGSAVIGSVAGAVIGHAVGGRQGAAVGAAIGGVSGAVISTQPRAYYDRGYDRSYERAPVTYTQAYYQAPVAYYPTAYYPVRERVVYPVRYSEYRGYRHHRDNGWHRGWDRDRDGYRDRDWNRSRDYSNY